MPRIRRKNLPRGLVQQLLDRLLERGVSVDQLRLVLRWMEAEPIVPEGSWFKRFPGVIVCGQGELIKTFLRPDQTPIGTEVR